MTKLLIENVKFQDEKMLKNNYNALKLSVDYQKGGYNWFDGNHENGGIYLYLQPMEVTEDGISFVMFDDSAFKIRVQELSRKNQNKINKVFLKVKEYKNLILDLFIENRKQDIFNLVKSFAV